MVDRSQPSEATENEEVVSTPTTPRRPSGGYRSTDARDTVAEMAARAQEISMEAGSKVAAAMKDVISAAAGLTGFAVESARDLVQYMIRRGQMTPEEGDKLLREAEDAYIRRGGAGPVAPATPPSPPPRPAAVTAALAPTTEPRTEPRSDSRPAEPKPPESRAPEPRATVARTSPARGVDARAGSTKPAAGSSASRPAAKKAPSASSAKRPAAKATSKASSKSATGARAKAPPSRAKAAAKSRPAARKRR
jgi:polyhydroxyalkanoate synthesis regulator phasin